MGEEVWEVIREVGRRGLTPEPEPSVTACLCSNANCTYI
jgi:hypothetical protein